MNSHRTDLLEWIDQGRLRRQDWWPVLRSAGVLPGRRDWHKFLDQLTLWLGTVFCAAAVIFFFAYNWRELGRFAKFGLIEALIVAGLLGCWRLDLDGIAGKAVLLLNTLLVGALLALVGQTYQTGADPWELFAVWAAAVLAWVLIGRFDALWLVWLGLLNLAIALYFQAFGIVFGFAFGTPQRLWALWALNSTAWLVWELLAQRGVVWLGARWPLRLLATASGSLLTTLVLWALFDFGRSHATPAALAYFAWIGWIGAVYAYYRLHRLDVFVLAGGVLSAIVVVAALLGKTLLRRADFGAFLLIGLVVIGLSAWGGFWLKALAAKERT